MPITTELKLVLFFAGFISFVALLLALGMPEEYAPINKLDLTIFGGSVIGVASACVVITGVPCAVALAVFGVITFFENVVFASTFLQTLIFIPVSIGIIYVMSKLGRGGG